jgi:hypothetical protein
MGARDALLIARGVGICGWLAAARPGFQLVPIKPPEKWLLPKARRLAGIAEASLLPCKEPCLVEVKTSKMSLLSGK